MADVYTVDTFSSLQWPAVKVYKNISQVHNAFTCLSIHRSLCLFSGFLTMEAIEVVVTAGAHKTIM